MYGHPSHLESSPAFSLDGRSLHHCSVLIGGRNGGGRGSVQSHAALIGRRDDVLVVMETAWVIQGYHGNHTGVTRGHWFSTCSSGTPTGP